MTFWMYVGNVGCLQGVLFSCKGSCTEASPGFSNPRQHCSMFRAAPRGFVIS